MKLVSISENIMVNPDCISCIEQRKVNKQDVIIVWVDGKSYTVEASFVNTFLKDLDKSGAIRQEFGG